MVSAWFTIIEIVHQVRRVNDPANSSVSGAGQAFAPATQPDRAASVARSEENEKEVKKSRI